ncbi:MAG: endopeptidase La [Verrucomicrobia bacterium]|jgi:ATP-dependent Lon protease|nr:endopeptidase La [Verrucomicrobiota bacterium]OQC67634.1 MAG: Lon protease 2 [Verrucomicrobia bacterium ADurb.Bin006]MDI9381305.1 endopeptidase La [Verrucomicrobiota bacterium]NMD21055.1 endopeptidase La [Verrucomicrobiota bacterium]HNU99923.1 endopeptidase La [Verrucomicrobiota bacterium]
MHSADTESISISNQTGTSADLPNPRVAGRALPDVLPILGLSDIVVFPGMVVPLVVESSPSTRLIDDVVAGDRFVGLVLQKKAELENPGPDDLWTAGCAARVLRMLKFPDNTTRVLVEGLRRIRLIEFVSQDPYLQARHEHVPDVTDDSIETTALARSAREHFVEVIEHSPTLNEQIKIPALQTEQPGRLADLMAAHLNLTLEERQTLLETADVKQRLKRILPLLTRELEVLKLGSKIQKEVTTSMSKSQRDYYLREQIRAIQRELGEGEEENTEAAALREQIEAAQLPPEAHKVALKELDRLRQIPPAAAEYTVSRNYLDWIVNLPWARTTPDKLDLAEAERILDTQHYGLIKVKDRLIEFLAVLKLRQQLKGPILCLVGPPGVGKTSLGKSVADALGRKFVRIALGGMRDEAEIRGHRRTYIGALPGRILQSLRRVESRNPVMLLDEIDKVGADFRGDPAAALLEVLDPEQNQAFVDHYLDLPFDLSRVLFITTANWLDPVHPALRDRLEVIELPSYTAEEKYHIARRHLLPRQLAEHGLRRRDIHLPPATLRRLIRDYTREAGVRQLDRELAALSRKAARRLARRGGKTKPLSVRPDALSDYLGPVKFLAERAETIRDCGIATGLAWTPVGGEILFVEATRMPGTGKLTLTGSLGEVMKESAMAALSYLRSLASSPDTPGLKFDKHDLHIHVPAGATPKDGPSAGLTMVVALASLLHQRRVRSDTAMTGEISLRGRVLPVGGIKEKVLAAARSGIRRVILPRGNQKDWREIPKEVSRRLAVEFVDRIDQALEAALATGHPRKSVNRRKARRTLP